MAERETERGSRPSHYNIMPDMGACGKPRVMPHSHRHDQHGQSRNTIDGVRDRLTAVLPWHPGGPEARRPDSTRLFLELHRPEVDVGLLQRDPARGYLGSGAGKRRGSGPNLRGGTDWRVHG